MKSFGQKAWMLPQPVLIIGTYNNDGTPNAMNAAWGGQWDSKEIMISMGLITYDPIHHGYVELGKRVGNAFSDGKKLK